MAFYSVTCVLMYLLSGCSHDCDSNHVLHPPHHLLRRHAGRHAPVRRKHLRGLARARAPPTLQLLRDGRTTHWATRTPSTNAVPAKHMTPEPQGRTIRSNTLQTYRTLVYIVHSHVGSSKVNDFTLHFCPGM